jgi:hypothetical protein
MDAEVRIIGDRLLVTQEGVTREAPLALVLRALGDLGHWQPNCGILPRGVRVWMERGDATAVAIELPPQARTVRWLAADSRAAYGRGAKYERYFLSFPYIELLLVFRHGGLTGYQQLYYRNAPLDEDEALLLPNLYNVANGYGQRCWVCLASLADVSDLAWPEKVHKIVEHVFGAAFNRSSEEHESNSLWGAMAKRRLDPRVQTVEAWQAATRENPRFALEVAWKRANTTVTQELTAMLDHVAMPLTVATAADFGQVVTLAGARRARA